MKLPLSSLASEFDNDDRVRLASVVAVEAPPEREVRAVALVFVDSAGIARMKCVPVDRLDEAAECGVGISVVFSGAQSNDRFAPLPGIDGPVGDLRLRPDLDALAPLTCAPGWGWAPVDQYDQEGAPWPACQRRFLRRMTEQAGQRGLELLVGFELEWVLGRDEESGLRTAHSGPGYGAATFGAIGEHMLAVVDALRDAGVEVLQIHPEYGVGQVELSLAARGPIRACDEQVLARHVIRTVAERDGWRASFAPVVLAGSVGNGGHVHVSIQRDGENVTTEAEGEAFVAGVLDQLDALTALAAPSPVSALRLQPSSWAGAFACWGWENREAALRIADASRSPNVEWKSPDGAANPYLALGGLIAAGLDGIARDARLPEPVRRDPGAMTEKERSAAGIRRLPDTLAAATDAFERNELLREAMGEFLHATIVSVRREEVEVAGGLGRDELVAFHRWRY
jgi:glutamine synthetase